MIAVISAWTAHLFAWAASVWLVLGPAYQGVAVTTEGTTRVSATFIETNGLHVIWVTDLGRSRGARAAGRRG